MRSARILVALALAAPLLAGCGKANMDSQAKAKQWDENAFFADRSSMREPVPGTVARDAPDVPAPQPKLITAALVERGRRPSSTSSARPATASPATGAA